MTIKLYTSEAGLKRRLQGDVLVMFAFTTKDNTNNIEVTVNFDEIKEIHSEGMFSINRK